MNLLKSFAFLCILLLVRVSAQHKQSRNVDRIHLHIGEFKKSEQSTPQQVSKLFAQRLLVQFSNKTAMKIKDFEKMLFELEKQNMQSNATFTCVDASKILMAIESQPGEEKNVSKSFLIDVDHMITVCPVLLYHIASQESFMNESACIDFVSVKERELRSLVWLYATLALVGISLCGLFGVIVIPIIDKNYYFYVLQFFMALAVGTLTGDALLHLLPHSMRATSEDLSRNDLLEMMMHRGIAAILGILVFCILEQLLSMITKYKNRSTQVTTEEDNKQHSTRHGHSHGPVDTKSESLSSIVWMVILGDGLHNFTDGMAIGAAFSNNIAGGFSTTVAVFCHELPHELGDFAVLLKAGMSARKAIYYNILSSILSFIGMSVGIMIGETPETTQWVFAVAAGLFIYIALVDMVRTLSQNVAHLLMHKVVFRCQS